LRLKIHKKLRIASLNLEFTGSYKKVVLPGNLDATDATATKPVADATEATMFQRCQAKKSKIV